MPVTCQVDERSAAAAAGPKNNDDTAVGAGERGVADAFPHQSQVSPGVLVLTIVVGEVGIPPHHTERVLVETGDLCP